MAPRVLALKTSGMMKARRLSYAIGVAGLGPLLLIVLTTLDGLWGYGIDPVVPWLASTPFFLLGAWMVVASLTPPRLVVHVDSLEIRHPRMLSAPLVIRRSDVSAVMLDDGELAGAARFATGDDSEPFLWAGAQAGVRQPGRALLGDDVLPNLAIVPREPIAIGQARSGWTALSARGEPEPPPRDEPLRAIMLAVRRLDAAERAFAGWPVQRPPAEPVLEPELRPGASLQRDWMLVMLALLAPAPLIAAGEHWVLAPQAIAIVAGLVRYRRRAQVAADAARVAADGRPPERRAATQAALDANWGPRAP